MIKNVVFTDKICLGLEPGDEPNLMKLLAYYNGLYVLEGSGTYAPLALQHRGDYEKRAGKSSSC